MENTNVYGCTCCPNCVPYDEIHWLTNNEGVCEECYSKIPENLIAELEDVSYEYLPDALVDFLNSIGGNFTYHNK